MFYFLSDEQNKLFQVKNNYNEESSYSELKSSCDETIEAQDSSINNNDNVIDKNKNNNNIIINMDDDFEKNNYTFEYSNSDIRGNIMNSYTKYLSKENSDKKTEINNNENFEESGSNALNNKDQNDDQPKNLVKEKIFLSIKQKFKIRKKRRKTVFTSSHYPNKKHREIHRESNT